MLPGLGQAISTRIHAFKWSQGRCGASHTAVKVSVMNGDPWFADRGGENSMVRRGNLQFEECLPVQRNSGCTAWAQQRGGALKRMNRFSRLWDRLDRLHRPKLFSSCV